MRCYSKILDHIGGWGRYQILLLFIALPFSMAMSFVGLTPTLLLYTPDHRCANRTGTILRWQSGEELLTRYGPNRPAADIGGNGRSDILVKWMDICEDEFRSQTTYATMFVWTL